MRYIILILWFCASCSKAQSIDAKILEIEIMEDSIAILKEVPQMLLSIRIKNNSEHNMLLYGLGSNVLNNSEMDRLCNPRLVGGGLGIFIFNEQNKRQYSSWSIPDSIDHKPMPREKFEELMKQGTEKYLRGTRVAIKSDFSFFQRRIDLQQYMLKRGTYYLQVVYYSGVGIKDNYVVGEEQIERDRQFYNAEIYQGCAVSNRIVFWVR